MLALAANQFTPVENRCHSRRRNARIAKPMWLPCPRLCRWGHRSTPPYGFKPPMVLLDPPGPLRVLQPLPFGHRQVVADPVFGVAVAGHDPERLDQTKSLPLHDGPAGRDGPFPDRPLALPVQVEASMAADL